MADNMNKGGADRSRDTNQDQARRQQGDTQRENMGNREQGRQEEDAQRSNMGNRGQGDQQRSGRGEEDRQRTDMGNRGQGDQQSGRIQEDMHRSNSGNPSNVPPQPTKSSVPEGDSDDDMDQRISGSRELRDTDVDTNEGRSSEEDLSGRSL